MNWRVSDLDRFVLVSNSDAHSPQKLGREANIFHVAPAYPDLARALRTREGFGGTLEFFPQEGKYHLDGHRHCGLRLEPDEAERLSGLCPQCGKPLPLGVMHRVQDLADRRDGARPAAASPFESLISLPGILAEVLVVNAASKKVRLAYFRLLAELGPELEILRRVPLDALAREGGILLAQGGGSGVAAAAAKGGASQVATLPTIDPLGTLAVVGMGLPLAALFAAGLMTIALFAKSYKEAQSYVSPLIIVIILPAMMAMLPGVELSTRLALVPILNLSLVSKELVSGVWHWHYLALIFGSSCLYAAAALARCVRMFNRESVLFRS